MFPFAAVPGTFSGMSLRYSNPMGHWVKTIGQGCACSMPIRRILCMGFDSRTNFPANPLALPASPPE